jgi:hypothetical protein
MATQPNASTAVRAGARQEPAIRARHNARLDPSGDAARWLLALGEGFKTWATVRSHPGFGGWLIYRTATHPNWLQDRFEQVCVDCGLEI